MKVLLLISSLCWTFVSSFSIPVTRPAVITTTTITSLYMAEANGAVNPASTPKKVIVLGGDGFCGWPTCLYLSDQGHDVIMVDNLSRRNIDIELGCDSLTPIQSPEVSV
jgi:UDP-sulfoquinovose synthase